MGSLGKPHAVFVPYPSQGHISPLMQFAKLLHSTGSTHITFVNTEYNHNRWIRSKGHDFVKGLPDFCFKTIPDGLPPSDRDETQDLWALSGSISKNCLGPFRELLAELGSSPGSPPVTCIIADGLMNFAIEAAHEIGVPGVSLWTASACGFIGYFYFKELIERGFVPFKDENFITDGSLDAPIDFVPGMSNIRLRDFPTLIRTADRDDIMLNFMGDETRSCIKASAIIFHTFDEIEHQVLDVIAANFFPNIYTIGPFSLLEKQLPAFSKTKSMRSSLWKEDSTCLDWLDKREPNSVLFVSFGSITVMSDQQFQEFAWGLANSKHPFLWVIRPDIVKGSGNGSAILPEKFYEEIKGRGLIVSWCPQDKVLAHRSTGAFLTHSGWNSMLESVCGGKPVICWPFFDEQPTNCYFSCNVWGIGMEIDRDVRREEVEELVKEMMGDKKGEEMRKKAQEWKKKAEESTIIGGSSYNNLDRFIMDFLH